jgi:oxygen-independent coproporphyrinogen-3 oxidase
LALEPDHLSLYALTLDDPAAEGLTGATGDHLPASSGARRWRTRARAGQDDDRAAAQYRRAVARLAAGGWRGYEISSWARPGHECRHNQVYWDRRPYEGLGPGAHAFDGATRRWTAASLGGYLAALAPTPGTGPAGPSRPPPAGLARAAHVATSGRRPALPPGGRERLDDRTAATESLILALRTDRGVDLAEAAGTALAAELGWALERGLAEVIDDGRVVLTTTGRLLSNELFERLL